MKIKLIKYKNNWRYFIDELDYSQKQFDYIFKHLDFDKLSKDCYIYFSNKKTEKWLRKTYINEDWLKDIYDNSPEGYAWLNENWCKDVFKLYVYYLDKQELKTIINRVINVSLITGDI